MASSKHPLGRVGTFRVTAFNKLKLLELKAYEVISTLGENEVLESERIYPRPSLRYNSGLLSPDLSAPRHCLSHRHNIPMLFFEIQGKVSISLVSSS